MHSNMRSLLLFYTSTSNQSLLVSNRSGGPQIMLIYQIEKPFHGFFVGFYISHKAEIYKNDSPKGQHHLANLVLFSFFFIAIWWFLNLAFLSYLALIVIKLQRLKEGIGSLINSLKRIKKRTIGNSKNHIYKIIPGLWLA